MGLVLAVADALVGNASGIAANVSLDPGGGGAPVTPNVRVDSSANTRVDSSGNTRVTG